MAVADGTAPIGVGAGTGAGERPDPEVESVVLDLVALSPEDIGALPGTVLGTLLRQVYDTCAEGSPFVTGHTESQ
ncbi:FxSxx-COOH cyclophane-containing RiPP peptide [Streptomyces graminilatus]|uniref:FxSxx-COOH cyclophane-containing RiPP peptide n=1 Tax=Streptomyces graminilatus TaxID=1464070 RepID=UPI0006E38780|nr:FxSxx-COOH cyclophane-containing RiPP peptide [Streptomyces graminilatus]